MYGFIGRFSGLIANFGFSPTFSDLFLFLCSSSCVFGDLHRLLDILLSLSPQHAIIGMMVSSVEGNTRMKYFTQRQPRTSFGHD